MASADRAWPNRRESKLTGVSHDIHRTLPHSIEAEQGVLGSMLISPREIIGECVDKLTAEYFYVPAHQTIYMALVERWRAGQGIDLITFTQVLRDRNLLETVGGAGNVTALFTFVPTAANITYYLEILRDKYLLREIIATCTEGVRRSFEEQDEVYALLDDIEQKFYSITKWGHSSRPVKSIVGDVINNLSEPEKILGISTGFPHLDDVVGGLAEGAKIVLAGPISGGKSAFAECMANSLATRNVPTAMFTFEMSAEQKVQRLIQIRSEVSVRSIARQEAEMFEFDAFRNAASEIAAAPLWIIEDRLDIAGIRSRCLQLKPRVAIIDYLQIVPERKQRGENTTDKLDRMSAETKQIAHDLGLTIIELSQLTTDDKTGKTKTRGSMGITADSDQLWIIEGEDDEKKDVIQKQITVAKQRDGRRDHVPFVFVKSITKFRQRKN